MILNWNAKDDTIECVRSVLQSTYETFDVLVVDNGSTDGSMSALSQLVPLIELISNERNLGYADGNNVGIRRAMETGARYVCILNNDTIVATDFLDALINAAEQDTDVGVAAPTIHFFEDPSKIWSAGGSFDRKRGTSSMFTTIGSTAVREVDWVTGCAMLVRSEVFERAGLLDAKYFLYFEDNEWCFRVRRHGFKIIHVPQSRIQHKVTVEEQNASSLITYYMVRNHLLFLKDSKAPASAWASVLAHYIRMIASYILLPAHHNEATKTRAIVRGFTDFWLRRYGRAQG